MSWDLTVWLGKGRPCSAMVGPGRLFCLLGLFLMLGCSKPQEPEAAHPIEAAIAAHERELYTQAERLYSELLPYRPAVLGLGMILRRRGELAAAKTCFEDALPGEDALFELGATCSMMEDFEQAASIYAQILNADLVTWLNLAGALRSMGHEVAGWYWEIAAGLDPQDDVNGYAFSVLAEETDDRVFATLAEEYL